MFCPNCGARLDDDARFCPQCGASVAVPGPKPSSESRGQEGRKASPARGPEPAPKKASTPDDGAQSASGAAPEPKPASKPAPQPDASPKPAPAAQPQPDASPKPTPAAQPATQSQPTSSVTPQPAVQPSPAPQTAPQPQPARRRAVLVGAGVALLVLVAVIGAILLSAANTSSAPGGAGYPTGADDSWTVMLYICGSDLESEQGLATDNLMELQQVSMPDDTTFVIQTGGSTTWHNEVVSEEGLNRFSLQDGKLLLEDELPQASMGDAQTLEDFVRWGAQTYPAEHYALMFWDHGGGTLVGVCKDENNDDGMNLLEMNEALSGAGLHFDVVGFDTCLMATLETAQMLSDYAHYLVASEDVIPFGGWAYDTWPAWFAKTDDADDVLGLCTTIVDSYRDKCERSGVWEASLLSVVDLSRAESLAKAFTTAGACMAHTTEKPSTLQWFLNQEREVESYGYANYLQGYTNMVDLGSLVSCMREQFPQEVDVVKSELGKAVVYEQHGSAHTRSTGLSVFYPLAANEEVLATYDVVSKDLKLDNAAYRQFLSARSGTYDSAEWKDEGIADLAPVQPADAANAYTCTPALDKEGHFTVTITGNTEYVKVATYQFGMVQPDGSVVPLESGNDLALDIDEHGKITYTDQFLGEVMNVGGAYAYASIVDMVSEGGKPSYNLYSAPVRLTTTNAQGKAVTLETNLLIGYDYNTGSYEAMCYYDNVDESGMAAKSYLKPRVGDKLSFLVAHEVDGKVEKGTTGKEITWSLDTKVDKRVPPDATYLYQIVVTDIFGQRSQPYSALVTIKDGKRTTTRLA